ncbi:DNA-binding transcriptional regulator, PucR family [Nonomuraea solani]|uniref:DNA-binding transcriptional regulator, PucR family n=1 Tax=Nonomuraea solani TaxID=1144553 RepID=A0A1H5WBZ5_9ACTN|nr:PucR family transcriptional regulator [Nonomuraea solani]SEF96878.1 DNA-binding transcriptional regulator, PucR family [Nonomuraea solani]
MSESGLAPEVSDGSISTPSHPPLSQVLETLGGHVISAAYAPDGEPLALGEPIVHDPDDPLDERPGCVLLAVGSRVAGEDTHDLVLQAGRLGYHAVVVKDRGADLGPLIDTAKAAGIALLVAPQRIPWRQLDALLTAAISGPGASASTYSSVAIGDLFALANAIAMTIGGATTVEDPQGNVLGYSNVPGQEIDEIRRLGILGRKTPQRPTNRSEYTHVFKAGGPVRFESLGPGHMRRLATAVRAGAELLGFIWVLDGEPRVVPDAMRVLEDAGRLAALHLLRARHPSNPQRWHSSETLRALLDGTISESAAAVRLSLPIGSPVTIVAFAPATALSEPGTEAGTALANIADLISLSCEAWHPQAVCTTAWGRVYALLPVPPGTPAARLVRVATDAAGAVRKSTRLALHAGIGPVVEGLGEVPSSSKLAERVLRVLAETAHASVAVATDEQVRSRVALLDLADQGGVADGRLLRPVRRMLDYDRAHSTTHAVTLLAYFDAFGEAAKAATELSVHENTLRYRVRRLQTLFDVDLTDPTERLVIWLQLRLLRLRGEL